jgi:hypothetical protein
MLFRRSLLALAGALALSACAATAAPVNEGAAMITLTRGVCFGFCPDYTVSISDEGQVTYVGRRFVNVVGEQHATIPVEDVRRLLVRFDEIGFNNLRDEYRGRVTDLPTYTVTLERNGHRKTVLDYAGTSAGMPQAVRELEQEIDRVANTARWVLRDGQPVRTPPDM